MPTTQIFGLDQQYAWVPGATAAVLSLVALLIAFARFKETLRPHAGPVPGRVLFSLARTAEVLRMPAVGPLVFTYFLAIFAFANFEGTLSRFTERVFSYGVKENSLVFAGVGFVLVVAQGGFYRRFVVRQGTLDALVRWLSCRISPSALPYVTLSSSPSLM